MPWSLANRAITRITERAVSYKLGLTASLVIRLIDLLLVFASPKSP